MSDRPFIAARIETWVNRKVEIVLRIFGWREAVVPYLGYGNTKRLRVMARVVLKPPRGQTQLARDVEKAMARRGWRNFAATAVVSAPVRVTVGGQTHLVRTDRGGYIDEYLPNDGLEPGWQDVTLVSPRSQSATAPVQVIGDEERFGIVSDIDDTIITTFLPRPMIAAWNSFVLTEEARKPVPGMAEMYQELLAEHPGAPIVYISTGSFDTVPFLVRFLKHNGYPKGSLLMTDWGPTNTGWFRSGVDHKRRSLRELARDLPNIRWVLVGDDGQHDPSTYAEFAQYLPNRVRGVAIRQLSPTEQVLAHGTPIALDEGDDEPYPEIVREVRGPDGTALLQRLRDVLAKSRKQD